MVLERRRHSGFDALIISPDGLMSASELRELFGRYREGEGVGSILLPRECCLNSPPKLRMFKEACKYLYYNMPDPCNHRS